MTRRLVLIGLLALLSITLMAQRRFLPSRPASDALLYERPVFGVKGGVTLPWLSFTDPRLAGLPHDVMPQRSLGVFVEFPLHRVVTLAPELCWQTRGGSTTYRYAQRYWETYSIQADYLALRVPVMLYYPVTDQLKPYLFAGPDLGYAFQGVIQLSHDEGSPLPSYTDIISSYNFRRASLGAVAGAGIRYNLPLTLITLVFKADAALYMGLTDSYSKRELNEQSSPLNVSAYHLNGRRLLRGLEFHLGVGFFINKPDGCGGFRSNCYL
ncbi:MAG: PorT family protein [Bacteroidales bacterium]|nr:PorT family protein [Bacteroidales bacterium]